MTTLRLKNIPEKLLKRIEEEKLKSSLLKDVRKYKNTKIKIQDELVWLLEVYPKLFNKRHTKPLKTDILTDLLERHPDKNRHITEKAILFYTRNVQYMRNFLLSDYRFDLNGNSEKHITSKEKDYISKQLQEMEQLMHKISRR